MRNRTTLSEDFSERVIELLPDLRRRLMARFDRKVTQLVSIDDLIQEVAKRAFGDEKAPLIQGRATLLNWMITVAENFAVSSIRKKHATTNVEDSEVDFGKIIEDVGAETGSRKMAKEDLQVALRLGISRLKEEHQKVLNLVYFHELPFDAIAEQLATTPSAARGLHRNAKNALITVLRSWKISESDLI